MTNKFDKVNGIMGRRGGREASRMESTRWQRERRGGGRGRWWGRGERFTSRVRRKKCRSKDPSAAWLPTFAYPSIYLASISEKKRVELNIDEISIVNRKRNKKKTRLSMQTEQWNSRRKNRVIYSGCDFFYYRRIDYDDEVEALFFAWSNCLIPLRNWKRYFESVRQSLSYSPAIHQSHMLKIHTLQ